MQYETVGAVEFGLSLTGIGLNLLVRDVPAEVTFLEQVGGMQGHQVTQDFAIMTYHGQVMQLHADHTYSKHPLLGLLPENPPRGAGAQFHLYHTDPDEAAGKARDLGAHVLQDPANKPHGLREAFILDENGYAWVASRPLSQTEIDAVNAG